MKKTIALLLSLCLMLSVGVTAMASEEPKSDVDYSALSLSDAEWTYDADNDIWALSEVSYCLTPASPEEETINIYIPGAYMNEDGSFTEDAYSAHFATMIADLLAENDYSGLEGYDESLVEAYADAYNHEESIYLLNSHNFLSDSDVAQYMRIRIGTDDHNVIPIVSLNLARSFATYSDADVDFAFSWAQPHGEAEINSEDFDVWLDWVCRGGDNG